MKEINRYGFWWVLSLVAVFLTLPLANNNGSYWINVSWIAGVCFGMETIRFLHCIDRWKENKNPN